MTTPTTTSAGAAAAAGSKGLPAGRVVLLNGTSSAGKTTLALGLQDLLADPWQHMALDQFRDGLPGKFRGLNAPAGTPGHRGLNVVPTRLGDQAVTAVRFGDVGERVLQGMRRGIAAMARAGINVIVDDLLAEPAYLADYLEVLDGLDVLFVGVRCDLAVANARERARPGRFPGTAVSFAAVVHQHGCYDLEVDTGRDNPPDCARQVMQRLQQGPAGAAFATLRERLAVPSP